MIDTTALDALVAKTESSEAITTDKLYAKEWNITLGILKLVASKVNELDAEIHSKVVIYTNSFEYRQGEKYDSNGNHTTSSTKSYRVSSEDNIVVNPNTTYIVGGLDGFKMSILFFDKNDAFLSRTAWYGQIDEFTTPSNTAYLCLMVEPYPRVDITPEEFKGVNGTFTPND